MVYQNNNNRINPKAEEDRAIKPTATPLNKTVQYQPDITAANSSKGTAAALAAIGQGLMDMDVVWRIQAQENAIRATWETESKGGNRKDWAAVSKNIKGAAKFNPYNDDAYRQLQAQDVYRAAYLKLASTPEIEKMNPDKFYQLVADTSKQMIEGFKATGLSPKDYGDALVQWEKNFQTIEQNYTAKHADYTFQQLNIKETSDITFQLESALSEAEDGEEVTIFKQVLENKIKHLSEETGIVASDTQAKVIIGGIKNYIARNASQIDDAEVLAAISDMQLGDGKKLSEVVPNYDIMVKDLLSQAREVSLRQMKLEVEMKDFQQEQKVRGVMTDFMERYRKGEISSPEAMMQYAANMTNKYGLDGINSMKLFKDIATGRKTWTDLADVETDPRVAAYLGAGVITGSVSVNEIASAISSGKLNYKDGFHMMQNLIEKEKKQKTADDKHIDKLYKDAMKEMTEGYKKGGQDIDPILDDGEAQSDFMNEMNNLYNRYENDGDVKKFNDDLAKLKSSYKQAVKESSRSGSVTGFAIGFSSLRATPAINQNQWNQSAKDINKSIESLKQMGLVRNSMGWKDTQISVASAPQQNRKITVTNSQGQTYTKNTRHTGYDLSGRNVQMGKQVYSPMKGRVVGVLTEANSGGMGNMVLVQCENGKLIKYMHLQHADLIKLGTTVDTKTPIGRIGNTGIVGNKSVGSLHVEFYDSNLQWITARQFMEK